MQAMTFTKGNKIGRGWKKQTPLSSLVRKLDDVFSVYIRRRAADEGGTVQCVTCGKLMHWEKDGAQAGHFIRRRHKATRWRETNVHVQCVGCNKYGNGMEAEHGKFIIDTYGLAEHHDLLACKNQIQKWTRLDLEEKINFYNDKLRNLPT